jgi:hypothetical protein
MDSSILGKDELYKSENAIKKYIITSKVSGLRKFKNNISDMLILGDDETDIIKKLRYIGEHEIHGGIIFSCDELDAIKGTLCPYCASDIVNSNDVILCKNCRVFHHLECWKLYIGCTTLGCIYNNFLK